MPATVGSNWLGVLYPLLLFVVAEGLSVILFGWPSVKENWGKTVGVGFAVVGVFWTCLFLWCAVKTTFADHQKLVERVAGLHKNLVDTRSDDASNLSQVGQGLNAQIGKLKQDCAYKEGQNATLLNQNRDQQSSINNCQTQALKLLVPEAFKMTPLMMSDEKQSDDVQQAKILMLTNQTVTPVKMRMGCNRVLKSASVWILGSGTMAGGGGVDVQNIFDIGIDSPAWSTISPLLITVSYAGQAGILCQFQRQ